LITVQFMLTFIFHRFHKSIKEGYSLKSLYFITIGSSSKKVVTNRHIITSTYDKVFTSPTHFLAMQYFWLALLCCKLLCLFVSFIDCITMRYVYVLVNTDLHEMLKYPSRCLLTKLYSCSFCHSSVQLWICINTQRVVTECCKSDCLGPWLLIVEAINYQCGKMPIIWNASTDLAWIIPVQWSIFINLLICYLTLWLFVFFMFISFSIEIVPLMVSGNFIYDLLLSNLLVMVFFPSEIWSCFWYGL